VNDVQLSTVSAERSARARLDEAAVVDAALQLADSEGLDALTIRRLAQALGVTPTALYWHFADKRAVLDALGDRLWDEALGRLGPVAASDSWTDIRAVLEAVVAAFRKHPILAPLAPGRFIDSAAGRAITERTLEQLARVGYDERRAVDAARFLLCTALMLVTTLPGVAIPDAELRAAVMRGKRAAVLTLPPGRYPRLEQAAGHLFSWDDPDAYYRLGVDLIIGGLRSGTGRPTGS
jgi:TetR/AcrR family transcriptional regulator, tetracycline repressor protein